MIFRVPSHPDHSVILWFESEHKRYRTQGSQFLVCILCYSERELYFNPCDLPRDCGVEEILRERFGFGVLRINNWSKL